MKLEKEFDARKVIFLLPLNLPVEKKKTTKRNENAWNNAMFWLCFTGNQFSGEQRNTFFQFFFSFSFPLCWLCAGAGAGFGLAGAAFSFLRWPIALSKNLKKYVKWVKMLIARAGHRAEVEQNCSRKLCPIEDDNDNDDDDDLRRCQRLKIGPQRLTRRWEFGETTLSS